MLRLWPEHIRAGLFPGHCWLHSRSGTLVEAAGGTVHADADQLLTALGSLLDAAAGSRRAGAKVSVLLSDAVGAIAVMPWQKQIRTNAEIDAYARACFLQQGLVIGAAWVMYAEYGRFEAPGFAYAIPRAFVENVVTMLAARHLKLERMLPVSAMTYFRAAARLKQPGKHVIFLAEQGRVTAHISIRHRFAGVDVEPVVGTEAAAIARLCRRLAGLHGEVAPLFYWSADPDVGSDLPLSLDGHAAQRLAHTFWS